MRICPRCNGTGGTGTAPCHHCKGLGYVKGRTFGGDPRCRCGLIATFPEHDAEIQKLRNTLEKVMKQRDEAAEKYALLLISVQPPKKFNELVRDEFDLLGKRVGP